MLKNIPETLSPELLKILMEMGHFDEIVIGDANFPGASRARRLVRLDGLGITRVLNDILQFFPLDDIEKTCVTVMKVSREGYGVPSIWEEYKALIEKWEGKTDCMAIIPRADFYERAGKAYAVIATSESALFGNIILTKGIVKKD
ncbi:fucose isomerase [Oceanispirochaeta crateris]|uniref:Fucose isomerase n=1 Tax=Oceanispirochaeta crateris TaxID=2518645 RepID=A0A5C1QFF2_9SPIO|nr:RbsD/FucU domain-containing protein [Oceanispirochaeta crateris]QEN06853.1 fucose isomerase [Oceanispirochaeta crateris]